MAGPVSHIAGQFGNQSVATYAYDSNNQLINEHHGGIITYNTTYLYDSLGNRQQKIDSGAVTTNTYNAANQLLLSVPSTGQPTTSSYDRNGNLVLENAGGTLTTYTWDYENRLASVATLAAGTTTFVYSDDGHKQSTIISASTTNFLWDMDNILQEQSATGAVLAQYTQGPGTWGSLIGQRRGTTDQFYGADASQNVRLLFGATGSITDSWLYKAFGEVQNRTGSSVNYRQFGGNVNYWTELPTLLRAGARIYEPATGRWVSMDPIGSGEGLWSITQMRWDVQTWIDGINSYLYGYNNPISFTDPSGMLPYTPPTDHEALCKEICYENYESDTEICQKRRGNKTIKRLCWYWAETTLGLCIAACNVTYPPPSPFCVPPFPLPFPIPVLPEPMPIPIPV